LIGFVRIAQGGHFFTDVLWSAAIVWLISALLYYLMALHKEPLIIYETEAKALSPTQ
jgi:membrane-associated PAP2 superfamily phosphatase